ncbi:molybdate transport system substrate-binding protein [Tamilnaduibacter salinus]|uniref:Molybdate transport system substrate-binding protein n=1 Tax=Tamilnaduibacter salinus TaxID=1484056 RepID=A0A2U1CWG9_9GAMM|nr:molybdate transport system substrate-binding protein [Tamilnaduibacter salinus]
MTHPISRTAFTCSGCLLAVLSLLLLPATLSASPRITLYAAASLTDAVTEVAAQYEADHRVEVVPVFAASSTLARQIAAGAPADLFLSANIRWMDWLSRQSVTLHDRQRLLGNRLALIAPAASTLTPFTPGPGGSIQNRLGPRERLAVGDPDHVPAGLYARQSLESLGEWRALRPRLARADNVRAALALVARGDTPMGIVYDTDARASEAVRRIGLLPAASHPAIQYPIAVLGDPPSPAARRFGQWLQSSPALSVFRSFGFATPSTEPDQDAD